VKPESEFIGDLGADSLDIVELVMAYETEFKDFEMDIPDDDVAKLRTVGDAVDYIYEKVNA